MTAASRIGSALTLCILTVVGSIRAVAAGKSAHIGYVFPAGGRQGSTFEVTVGGENVYGATMALVSGSGVTAAILDSKDPNEGQLDPKKKNKKKNEAVIDERITVRITIAPDALPGNRDLCLATPGEISNKLIFQIGQLAELSEKEPNNKPGTATPLSALPVTFQGQIMPGDVDCFSFKAAKGQQLVAEVSARALLPYIADGVPGWFQAMIALLDSKGHELAVADDYRYNQDPVMFCEVPEDGEYTLSIRDTIYRGREDFVYRVRLGTLPYVTSVFPLGAALASNPVPVRLTGVNLSSNTLQVPVDSMVPVCRHLTVTNNGLLSNPIQFAVGLGSELIETKPALKAKRARTISTPVVVNSRLQTPGDKHYYRIQGKAGELLSVELMARRLGSPLDSCVVLYDGRGKKLAENDDVKDRGEGFLTHQSDSALTFTLPEDGSYTVAVYDTQGRGGEEYAYRLYLGPPVPDFELRMTPAALMVAKGGATPVAVTAIRRNGFSGEIRLLLQESSNSLTLDAGILPQGQDRVAVTLSASAKAPGRLAPRLFGTASIGGRTVTHEAVPAENLMQAFLYQHLFPFHEETLLVARELPPVRLTFKVPTNGVFDLPLGRDLEIPLTVVRNPGYHGPVRLQVVEVPKGISFRGANIPPRKEEGSIFLRADSRSVSNQQGTVIFSASMLVERAATAEEQARAAARAAREKEAREAAKGLTNGTTAVVTRTDSVARVSAVAATNVDVKAESQAASKRKPDPMMVTRPVFVTAPAIAYRIVNAPDRKMTENKPGGTTTPPRPKEKP